MDLSSFRHIRLEQNTELLPFKSDDPDLNQFLIDDAKKFLKERMAVTYLFEDEPKNKTVASYSLLNDKILLDPERKTFWNKLNRNISNPKRQKSYPAVKIGRLAVDNSYRDLGIGSEIIKIIKFSFSHQLRTGCRFLSVDAYASALDFYRKCGFNFLTDKDEGSMTHLMYYDLGKFSL